MHIIDHVILFVILIKTFTFHSSAPILLNSQIQQIQVRTGIRQTEQEPAGHLLLQLFCSSVSKSIKWG